MKKFVCLLTMMAMFPAVPALAAPADSYSAILANWQQHLCGDSANASKDVLAAYLKTTASNAAGQQKSMNKTNLDAGYLWPGKPIAPGGSSPNIGSAFESLRQMAKGYATPGTTTYYNASLLTDIAFGLNFLWKNVYHSGNITMTAYDKDTNPNGWYGNWWDWEIDMPDKLTDIMVMVGDELDSTTRSNALWMIDVFCQRPETGTLQPIQRYKYEGANRAWRVKCVILSSAMQQDAARLQNAVAQFRPLYQYVDEGEGFYRDGTFIAHTAFSYTGGYGITQIQYWSYIFQMIAGTQFDIGADEKLMLYDILENAFVPGLVNGAFMDMFRGREISRYNTTDYDAGHKALRAMLMLADDAPEPQRSRILGVVKEQERLSRGQRDIYSGAAIDEMIALDRILNDTSIANVPQTPFHKNYPYSDRTVHRGDGYTFGIAMFSERIHNFEGKERDENREGWYTGAGATYLYLDNDLAQYTDYYPTIDPTRLPGITASTRYPQPVIMRGDTEIPNRPYENSSVWNRQSWVGGVESGLYGVTGMQFEDI